MKKVLLGSLLLALITSYFSCQKAFDPSTNIGYDVLKNNNLVLDNSKAFHADSMNIPVLEMSSDTIPSYPSHTKLGKMRIGSLNGEKAIGFAKVAFDSLYSQDELIVDTVKIVLNLDSAQSAIVTAAQLNTKIVVKKAPNTLGYDNVSISNATEADSLVTTQSKKIFNDTASAHRSLVVDVTNQYRSNFTTGEKSDTANFTLTKRFVDSLAFFFEFENPLVDAGIVTISSVSFVIRCHKKSAAPADTPAVNFNSRPVLFSYFVEPTQLSIDSFSSFLGSNRYTLFKLDLSAMWPKITEGDSGISYANILEAVISLPIKSVVAEHDTSVKSTFVALGFVLLDHIWTIADSVRTGSYADTLSFSQATPVTFSIASALGALQKTQPKEVYLYMLARHINDFARDPGWDGRFVRIDWAPPIVSLKTMVSNPK